MTLSTKQRVRRYGLFTPAQIAEAMEIARTLPPPPHTELRAMGEYISSKTRRHHVDLPVNVAWRLWRLSRARGVPVGRVITELITYYVVAVSEAALDGVPELYADFLTPEGLGVLTAAMTEALSRVLGEGGASALAERMQHSRFTDDDPPPPAAAEPPSISEPVVEPTAFDTFSLTGEDDLPTLCITIRGTTADAVCRGLDDVREFVLSHDVEEWDGVKGADLGFEYECSALDDRAPVHVLHDTVTKALVAR